MIHYKERWYRGKSRPFGVVFLFYLERRIGMDIEEIKKSIDRDVKDVLDLAKLNEGYYY